MVPLLLDVLTSEAFICLHHLLGECFVGPKVFREIGEENVGSCITTFNYLTNNLQHVEKGICCQMSFASILAQVYITIQLG